MTAECNVLYLMSGRQHAHDYGADFLYAGFCELLGPEHVFAWPEGEMLHWDPQRGPRGRCELCQQGYDSIQRWPYKGHTLDEAIDRCHVAFLAVQPGDCSVRPPKSWAVTGLDGCGREVDDAEWTRGELHLSRFRERWGDRPFAVIDMSDAIAAGDGNILASEMVAFYTWAAGRQQPFPYFKRELPLEQGTWAIPCPLSYPRSRVPAGTVMKRECIFYHASGHTQDVDSPGIPRAEIVARLRALVPLEQLDVALSYGSAQRLWPYAYHDRMLTSLVGISWNGHATWDCNRFWELFAYGCAVVAERPRNQIPNPPLDGVHCLYGDTPEQVATLAAGLVQAPEKAYRLAQAGHEHFLDYHQSAARAEWVLSETLRWHHEGKGS